MKKISITDNLRVKDIASRAAEVLNIPLTALFSKTRKQDVMLCRMAVSNICRFEGIHYLDVADVLKRDRTSIYHYETNHEDLYDTWPKYQRLFDTLHAHIYDNPKKTLNKAQMRKMLAEQGVRNTKRGRINIFLTSGSSKYDLTVKYPDFCKTTDIIRDTFRGYEFNMKIAL